MVQVKEAVQRAEAYLPDVFKSAAGKDVRLEGVELSDDSRFWTVTFSYPEAELPFLSPREYKSVKLRAEDGEFFGARNGLLVQKLLNSSLRKAVLDTNLLLLWLVGQTDVSLLNSFKRVQAFTYEDIGLLRDILKFLPDLATTPHILSETSNFIDQAPAWRRDALVDELKRYIQRVVEVYQPAEALSQREEFNLLGLTDTGIAQLSSEAMVITLDFRLAGKIEALGGNAINFNHYRREFLLPH